MKKMVIMLAMVLGLLVGWNCVNAQVLYQEDFESYAVYTPASTIGFLAYGYWRVVQDVDANKVLRVMGGNYHIWTTQTFPYGTSVEFDIRHSFRVDNDWPRLVNITYGFGLPIELTPPEKRNPDGWPITVRTGGFNLYGWFMSDAFCNYIMMDPQPTYSLYMGNWYHMKWEFKGTVLKSYVDGNLVAEYDFAQAGSCPDGTPCFIEVPYYHLYWDGFDEITDIDNILVQEPLPIVVGIDILPGSTINPIKLQRRGKLPLAILSSPTFDAPTIVDVDTIEFAGSNSFAIQIPEDVNGDGLLDMVLQSTTGNLNLTLEDTEACLTGATLEGQQFIGCDDVHIIVGRERR